MHVVILGGTGFIGSRLTRSFAARPGCEVESYGSGDCDLTRPESVSWLQARIRPETCLLFCSTIARLRDDSLQAFHCNVAMAENVAAATFGQPVRSVVFCSSIDVYGRPPSESTLTEESAINPAGYYGLAKYVSERILQDKLGRRMPLAIFRLPGVYSLDQEDESVLGTLFSALRKHRTIELSGGGHQQRTYLHIDELDAVIGWAFAQRWTGLLNLGSVRTLSIRTAVELMRQHLGSTSRIEDVPANGSEFDICVDSASLRAEFPGFAPKPLDLCLRDLPNAV